MNEEDRTRNRQRNAEAYLRSQNRRQQSVQNQIQNIAEKAHENETAISLHSCGELNIHCTFCCAKHFKAEQPSDKLFTQCCHKGKVTLEKIRISPFIQQLMTFNHAFSKNFHENIRSINSALGFASMGANIATPPGYGPYCFRINGQIYHRTGA